MSSTLVGAADRMWLWVRRQTWWAQVLLWIFLGWLILAALVWRTAWSTKWKAAATAGLAFLYIGIIGSSSTTAAKPTKAVDPTTTTTAATTSTASTTGSASTSTTAATTSTLPPTTAAPPTTAPRTTEAPTQPAPLPAPPPTEPPAPATNVVHPGAFCSPAGATGVTSAGTSMVCGPASDGRNRWHAG